MAGKPSFQFYPGDWLKDPELGVCSPATRGIWVDLLCAIWNGDGSGSVTNTPKKLARLCRCDTDEMERAITELAEENVAVVTRDGDSVTILSRRLQKELHERKLKQERDQRYDNSTRKSRSSDADSDGASDAYSDAPSDAIPSSHPLKKKIEDEEEDTRVEIEGVQGEEEQGAPKPRRFASSDILAIYQAYPRKVGKRAALDEIDRALRRIDAGKAGPDPPPEDPVEWLGQRTLDFARSPAGTAGKLTPHPSTWYHQDRFDDDPAEWHRTEITHGKNGSTNGTHITSRPVGPVVPVGKYRDRFAA